MRIAVIDLGTNTCNLLVAEIRPSGFQILHQSKQHVKLGDSKIKTNEISDEATERVIQSFQIHKHIIQKFKTDIIKVVATSAIRTALNKVEFLNKVTDKTGLEFQVISGEMEAELIFKGALLAFNNFNEPTVILDIGGGSNELILADKKDMIWKESRPTGMGRVINMFKISDPIQQNEKNQLRRFFSKEHKNGFQWCSKLNVKSLVGCSGAFDTIADIIDSVDPGEKQRVAQNIALDDFFWVYDKLLNSTRAEHLKMKGMDMVRVDLIVPAVILIEQLVSKTGIKKIVQTDFALREGVLYEMMRNS